jgi:Leucine Rich repeat
LRLYGTQATDAGLVHLKGLTLKRLDLTYTKVTGAGLAHVERMTSLETLALGYTEVTDPGLELLFGLTKLQTLYLTHTKVTGAGVKDLRRAYPSAIPILPTDQPLRRPRGPAPSRARSANRPATFASFTRRTSPRDAGVRFLLRPDPPPRAWLVT